MPTGLATGEKRDRSDLRGANHRVDCSAPRGVARQDCRPLQLGVEVASDDVLGRRVGAATSQARSGAVPERHNGDAGVQRPQREFLIAGDHPDELRVASAERESLDWMADVKRSDE